MCGIVGYVGNRPVVDILIKGLKRLEYRGYDSAGVALFKNEKIEVRKSQGRLENIEKLLNGEAPLFRDSWCGIGHTRWATHGKPTTQNAHPHRAGHVVLVHNGIIENYLEIKKDLLARGHLPQSETDSELFGFLVLDEMESGASLLEAVRKSFSKLEGQCSIVVMSEREPGKIIGVRNGSPMVAANDPQGGVILASDGQPILEVTRDVVFLEHGDVVVGTRDGMVFYDLKTGCPVQRQSTHLEWSLDKLDKQGFATYMLKEIHEQPVTIVDTLNALLDRAHTDPFPLARQPAVQILDQAKELTLIACGTSWHAALIGKYWLEKFARIPVSVELASEFKYRDPVLSPGHVVIGVTQSGETADTLAAIRQVRAQGIPTLGITNVRGSSLSREADAVFYTAAGPEIGVAATKTFTAQMLVLFLLAGYLGLKRYIGNNGEKVQEISKAFEDLIHIPHFLSQGLDAGGAFSLSIKKAAKGLASSKGFFFIGRGYQFPIALEGALKLKEIAYLHAEGYAGGELKHGPIAMIDQAMTVVVLAPHDSWRDKTISNLEEVKARGAQVLAIGDWGDSKLQSLCDFWVPLPEEFSRGIHESLLPFVTTVAVQMLSYELATLKGTDVDKPRNLAKSVTVE
ncbi:glutamine--fructose-6-phosphate transaminase (isomerizing) [Bdellovibrionota bacterium FG-1]